MFPYLFKNSRGFSLLELMVSITIMLVIISVILSNQSTYTKGASLKNLANDIGLSLRQAQVYGISVKERSVGSGDFSGAYGIDFNLIDGVGSPTIYLFFIDRNANGYYDYTGNWADCPINEASECIKRIDITGGNTIQQLCLIASNGVVRCDVPLPRADVVFLRPDTKASITFFSIIGGVWSLPYSGLRIKLVSPTNEERLVDIYNTGQISIK